VYYLPRPPFPGVVVVGCFGVVVVGCFGAEAAGCFGVGVVGCPGTPPPSGPPVLCFSMACDANIDPNTIMIVASTMIIRCIMFLRVSVAKGFKPAWQRLN
jgi:hypothetical protein